MSLGRTKSRSSHDTSQVSNKSSHRPPPPLISCINSVARRVPSHQQSPKVNGSPLASFFAVYCGLAGVHEQSCGLRGSASVAGSSRALLSPGGSSLLVSRGLASEVRKPANLHLYRTISYARTDQAVGWDHCSPKANYQSGVETWVGSLLVRGGEGRCGTIHRRCPKKPGPPGSDR